VVVVGLAPGLLSPVSRAVGVQTPSNLLFFLAALVLLGVCLHLSWEVSRLEDETRRLAEEHAVLRLQVERLAPAAEQPALEHSPAAHPAVERTALDRPTVERPALDRPAPERWPADPVVDRPVVDGARPAP
jgi:hypothetical protein